MATLHSNLCRTRYPLSIHKPVWALCDAFVSSMDRARGCVSTCPSATAIPHWHACHGSFPCSVAALWVPRGVFTTPLRPAQVSCICFCLCHLAWRLPWHGGNGQAACGHQCAASCKQVRKSGAVKQRGLSKCQNVHGQVCARSGLETRVALSCRVSALDLVALQLS